MEIIGPSGCKNGLISSKKMQLENGTVPGNDCVKKPMQFVD